MVRFLCCAFAVMAVVTGCGPAIGTVKGRLVENGQPTKFPPTSASVQMSPVGADDKPDANVVYSAVVNEDGTFEVVASGGKLPPGKYMVAVEVIGKDGAKYKQFNATVSKVRREIKSGSNELTIDLAKPEG